MSPSDFPIVRQLVTRSVLGQTAARALSALDAARGSSRLARLARDWTAVAWDSTSAAVRLRMLSMTIATAAAVYILAVGQGPAHIHTALPVMPLVGIALLAACLAGAAEPAVRAWPDSFLRAVWIHRHRRGSS